MAENSKIEWTTHTFNPWEGCSKVSPGCQNCYAEARNHRYGLDNWGKGKPRRRTSSDNWKKPVRWNASGMVCRGCGTAERDFERALKKRPDLLACCPDDGPFHRPRVFCASLADWLDDEVRIEWLADLLKLIHDTPNLDWLLLTKRPEKWRERCMDARRFHYNSDAVLPGGAWQSAREGNFASWLADWLSGLAPKNVWIGTTVEDQKRADERIPELLKIPAKVRFLSVEPQLEIISLYGAFKTCWHMPSKYRDWRTAPVAEVRWERQALVAAGWRQGIHWVICGGESGPKRRPFNCDWARSLRDQCKAASVPFFMKQVDKVQSIPPDLLIREFPNEAAR